MILGVVRILQPVHGYDVRRELLSWGADQWASIQPGSVYHALKKLAADGLLREVASEQVGGRPARVLYEVTPKGDDDFRDLLAQHWWQPLPATDPWQAALCFLPSLPREEAVAALRARAGTLRAAAAGNRAAVDQGWATPDAKPAHVGWMLELVIARNEAEADWCDRIAERIEAGTPYMSAEFLARYGLPPDAEAALAEGVGAHSLRDPSIGAV
jgi:DNA-binding PadR family transcriptional regulator